jgi:hypothetical protein
VRTHLSQSCSQYEVVRNINGSVVGQLIGPALSIMGFFNTSVAVCIARDVTIPVCWIKYSVPDFVSMDGNGFLSAPLLVETTSSLEDQVSSISGISTPGSPPGPQILKSLNTVFRVSIYQGTNNGEILSHVSPSNYYCRVLWAQV